MKFVFVCRVVAAMLVSASCAAPVLAGQQPVTSQADQPPQQPPQPQPPPAQKPDPKTEEQQRYEETVVVSASKTEEKLVNAPATMSVLGPRSILNASTQNFADLLRSVPGVNVTQVSARDINITSRSDG